MAEKTYPIIGPDGTKFNIVGPDNASKEQIRDAASRAWEKIKLTNQSKKLEVKPTGPTNEKIMSEGANAPARIAPIEHGLGQTFLDVAKESLLGRPAGALKSIQDYVSKSSINDKLADLITTARTGASMAGGAALGIASGSPVVASAGMASIDQSLRQINKEDTGSSIFPGKTPEAHAGAMVTGTLENEVYGAILPIWGRVAGLAGKTKIGNRALELLKLKPTLGQLTGHELIEDVFSRSRKLKGIEESTGLAHDRLNQIVSGVTGRTNPSMETLSELHQGEVKSAFRSFVNASNNEADNVIAISELYPHQLPPTVTQVPNPTPVFGGSKTIPQITPGRIVKGPIWADTALPKLVEIRKEIIPTHLSPDPDTPVANAIRSIFKDINAEFDPTTGNLIKYDPMDFQVAWKNKQLIDKMGYGNTVENINAVDSRFRSISKALNKDIDESIYKWSSSPNDLQTLNNANAAWKKSKAIVSVRHALFGPEGETGKSAVTFLNTKNAPDSVSNAIMYDHKKLERFLKLGNYKIGDQVITSTNAKKDAQGYMLQKFFNDNYKATDPINLNIGIANGEKMATDFNNYVQSKAGRILFNRQQVRDYADMFAAIEKVTKSPDLSWMSRNIAMNFGTKTAAISGPILAGSLAAGSAGTITVLGAEASLYGVARIMTNKNAAPLFVNMLHNRPLGMSFQAASRAMVQALSGQRLTLNMKDGSKQESIVGTDGKIRPIK